MFGFIRGRVLERFPVDARFELITVIPHGLEGIGVNLTVLSLALERQLGKMKKNSRAEVNFFIYHYLTPHETYALGISEDKRYRLFLTLVRYSGIGPKMAALMVEFFDDFNTLLQALVNKDVDALSQVPGIGKKKAGKILVNLIDVAEAQQFIGDISVKSRDSGTSRRKLLERYEVLIGALQSLGLSKREALELVRRNVGRLDEFVRERGGNVSVENITKYTGELLRLILSSR